MVRSDGRRKQKGLLEDIVMTIIFLLIAVAVTFFAIFSLITSHAQQFEASVTLLDGTSHPINFASGAADSVVLEQGIQAMAVGDRERAQDTVSLLKKLTTPYDIETYTITFKNKNRDIASESSFIKFCGSPTKNEFAYCRLKLFVSGKEIECPAGSKPYPDGQQACGIGERCCLEDYDFVNKKYKDIPQSLVCTTEETIATEGGTVTLPTGNGICEAVCSVGRSAAKESVGCGGKNSCCRPNRSTASLTDATDSVSIPLIYRQTPGNPDGTWGSLEIAISIPNEVLPE